MEKLFAGVSETIITPPVGLMLLGPFQPSTGVHDELFARALVLTEGTQRVAIVCLDLVGMDFSLVDEIRTKVHQRTGINTILLNCSHTHSAPFTIPWSVQGWELFNRSAQEWRTELVMKIDEVVSMAAKNLHEAVLRIGRAAIQIGFNRRLSTNHGVIMKPNPDGVVVPWVDVLRIDDINRNPVAILFSHAAHPVIVHGASTLISADFPCFAVDTVKKHFGDKVIAMFAQACCGNINAEPLRGGFELAKIAGIKLGNAVVQAALESKPLLEFNLLKTVSVTLKLPFQNFPTSKECKTALKVAEEKLIQAQQAGTAEEQIRPVKESILCLQDLLKKIKDGEAQNLRFEINALVFGNEWCLLAMTHEVFADYQLWVEKLLPFKHTMVLAYTNGCESYIPLDSDFELGGYEACSFPSQGAALAYRYRMALKPGIEQIIKETILKMAQ